MTEPAPLNTGPCEPWTTAAAAVECCTSIADSDLVLFEAAVDEASELLYELSGRRFPGLCEKTVRPCSLTCSCFQVLSRGHVVGWDGRQWDTGRGGCGCRPVSKVTLTGYPVREILEVTIDGTPVDAAGYRLDRRRDLVRLDGARWPSCQQLGVDDGPGTFFVNYLYGIAPPLAGVQAANQLACQLALACTDETAEDCDLPPGTARVTRAGITIDIQTLGAFLTSGQTGLAQIDAFLSVYGRKPQRPAAVYTPELDPFPLPVN